MFRKLLRTSCSSVQGRRYKWGRYAGAFSTDLEKIGKPTHIIVGAGSAGCVLANRLTENPSNRVLLLEAGPRDWKWNWKFHMPAALMYNLCDDKYNWFYHTTAQKNLSERAVYWPRGRVWGGSSTLNAMVYARGHPYDYDRWEAEGAAGWSYKHVLPYFKKAQSHELAEGPDDLYRGWDGPLHVIQGRCDNPLHRAFIESGELAGIGTVDDTNGYKQEGTGPFDLTIHKGERWSTSRGYLWPALSRQNLYTSEGIMCTRVLFDKKKAKAIGIEFIRKDGPYCDGVTSWNREKIYCEECVILSGGAINTPQLLLLSGVGPADQLKAHDIPLILHLPGVGKNLQDHLEVYVQQVLHPDIQFHFLPSTVHDDGRTCGYCHAYQVHVGPMRSKSVGVISLASNDPRDHPVINPNYLDREDDFKEFRHCVRWSRILLGQKSFDLYRGVELAPGPDCLSDKQIDDFVRAMAASGYHPCGTCKMGDKADKFAVVNPETMSVYGIENLYVADASVVPSIVSGNLNAPVIMIAERAADLIQKKPPLAAQIVPVWTPEDEEAPRQASAA